MRVDGETGEIMPERIAAYSQRMRRGWQLVKKYGFFSPKEEQILGGLADLMDYENKLVVKGKALTTAQMSAALYEDRRNFMKVFNALKSKNAIIRVTNDDVEVWYVNPCLYRRGRGYKGTSAAFAAVAKEHAEQGGKKFDLPHEKYRSSLVYPR